MQPTVRKTTVKPKENFIAWMCHKLWTVNFINLQVSWGFKTLNLISVDHSVQAYADNILLRTEITRMEESMCMYSWGGCKYKFDHCQFGLGWWTMNHWIIIVRVVQSVLNICSSLKSLKSVRLISPRVQWKNPKKILNTMFNSLQSMLSMKIFWSDALS